VGQVLTQESSAFAQREIPLLTARVITLLNRFLLMRAFTPRAARRVPRIMWATFSAGGLGVGAGALVLTFTEGVLIRLAAGGAMSTSVTALVLLLLLPELRTELVQVLTSLSTRLRAHLSGHYERVQEG
jgi:hypothetical protein